MFKMIMKKSVWGINKKADLRSMRSSIAGNTLVSILFFLLALGLIGKPAMDFYESWKDRKAISETNDRLAAIDLAIRNYVTANGRYPCPAQMTAGFDTPNFGVEQLAECNTDTEILVRRTLGHDGLAVRAGAVPVRTLGLPDLSIADGYGHRYIYTITEQFTRTVPTLPNLETVAPAIMLVDDNNNIATRDEGNIVFAVTSVGDDSMGAYNTNGMLLANCDSSARSYENCNMDATLKNTVNKSLVETNQKFTQNIRFKTGDPCINSYTKPPQKMAYLLDTSGSMVEKLKKEDCEGIGYGKKCDRMDAAHWALRRAIASRQALTADDPNFSTDFTGFIGKDASPLVSATNLAVMPKDNIEEKLKNMCPSGQTPLGEHISALAKRIGAGESVEHPNAILVISDGYSNQGVEPLKVAQEEIYKTYKGKLIVHIVDMGDNEELEKVAKATNPPGTPDKEGAQYFKASNPQALKDWLLKITGTCESKDIPEPVDERHC
jgi:hypothetical protein